ncbi:hypothetical protein P5G50_10755 [Leifsonia sp. F6_8S_P_1B]|uniref:MYXO-CTERM domain-containing protein n=1 Tax=Leifsonia williamsii TaxID=3035919 RepID=A0ABT8KBW4_9MICO|nr:hypothetical protein [Leifsonia williamsii]MDN4614930.1 hypothetical protein [Leifsonia williamsii]
MASGESRQPEWPQTEELRSRVGAVRLLAWIAALVAAVPLFGLVDLATTLGLSDPRYAWAMSLAASWGSLLTFVVAAGFGWVGAVPRRPAPGLGLLGLATLGLLVGSALLLDARPLGLAVPLGAVTALLAVLLRPYVRPSVPAWRWRPSPPAIVAALGVPLWAGYVVNTEIAALIAPPGSGDDTVGIDHWPVQLALGVVLAVGSALLTGAVRQLVLWRWSFGLTAVAVAWATLAYPDRAGAMPHPVWGVLFVVWGALLALPSGRRVEMRRSVSG